MSKLEAGYGEHPGVANNASPTQFAHGGNGSPGLARRQPSLAGLPVGPGDQNQPAGDSLVMLQLASFEGRAL